MGIPRERKARREQIITYLNESMVKMCSRPQTEMVMKIIAVSKTGKLGASPSTPAKKQLYKKLFFIFKKVTNVSYNKNVAKFIC